LAKKVAGTGMDRDGIPITSCNSDFDVEFYMKVDVEVSNYFFFFLL
tara:strand:+ start:351 stop:488 length:138 start_codon:yes stop_codon:yes gene_type:complete